MEYVKVATIDVENELDTHGMVFRLDVDKRSWLKLNASQVERASVSENIKLMQN